MMRFLSYIWKEYRKPAIVLGILGILSSITIVMSYCLKYSVDCIFHVSHSSSAIAIMLFGLMAVTTYLSDQLGENYLVEKYSLCFVRNLRRSLVEHHLHMDYGQAREREFFLEHGIQFIVAVIGAALMMGGDLTPGGVAVATTVFSTFLVPSLSQLIGLIKEAGSSQEIVNDIMQKIASGEESTFYHRAQMPLDVLLRLEDAGCTGRNGTIFKEVSLEVPSSGLLGISGMSGEGKSTLAKMVAGLLQPISGDVIYNSLYFVEEDICGRIAYLDSEPYFMDGTILENLKASGDGWDEVLEMGEVRALLDELPDRENTVLTKDATTLSGGQRQLLGLARVLVKQDARLIILDEPTASMDEGAAKRVWKMLKRLSEEKCVLIVSHQKELLAEIPIKYCMKNQHLEREN